MNPERWRRLDNLLQSVLERPREQRESFLRQECAGDRSLEEEARSLLALEPEACLFLESPAIEVAAKEMARRSHENVLERKGQAVSHYRILDVIGRGGMGVVYKAEDSRLKRLVALKFLSDQFARDPVASDRFRREAQAASGLNHPGICTVHDIGEHDGQCFIVMEYLQGETLRQRIHSGERNEPVAPAALLAIGIEIADALEAAHQAGIVHRDIKPANVFITAGESSHPGHTRILDFGLAQLASGEDLTHPGMALGTALYMSPEQAIGTPADTRMDLFSFGLVLYEMATGRVPSVGTRSEAAPAALERIISRCLRTDPGLRYQRASEIARDLRRLQWDEASRTHRAPRWRAACAISAIVLATLGAAYFLLHRAPKLTDKDTLVVADFLNDTGDAVFDGTLRDGLAAELGQSPFLSLLSEDRIRHTLRQMDRRAGERISFGLAREICERTGGAAVLEGSISKLGTQYVVGLRARNCHSGDVLDGEQERAERREDVLNALSRMTGKLRVRLGESLAAVPTHAIPLTEATTPSLEAWKAFSIGMHAGFASGHLTALPWFRRATEIDSGFATAYAWLGRTYAALGESDAARETTTRAWQLRGKTTDQERFYIDFSYYRLVTGDLDKAIETCRLWAQTYPRDAKPHSFLGSSASSSLGRFENAAEENRKAIELDADNPMNYANLAADYIFTNRMPEAETTLDRATARNMDVPDFLLHRYLIAFLKADTAEMSRLAVSGEANPELEDLMLDKEGSVLAYSGHLQRARLLSQRATDLARRKGRREAAAQHVAAAAVREALFGYPAAARRLAASARGWSRGRDAVYGLALGSALAGERTAPQTVADDLETRFPRDTMVQFSDIPVLRAVIALGEGQPSKAIGLLQTSRPYDLGYEGANSVGFAGSLYAIYVRGIAYLELRQGAEATVEFRKILDHGGVVFADPIGALSRLQLGRALLLAGNRMEAEAAYHDFLRLWNDADPDLPILRQAKSESAGLR